jgi:hypothetical protein
MYFEPRVKLCTAQVIIITCSLCREILRSPLCAPCTSPLVDAGVPPGRDIYVAAYSTLDPKELGRRKSKKKTRTINRARRRQRVRDGENVWLHAGGNAHGEEWNNLLGVDNMCRKTRATTTACGARVVGKRGNCNWIIVMLCMFVASRTQLILSKSPRGHRQM